MTVICIDIGNTTTHVGTSNDDEISNHFYLPTKKLENDYSELLSYIENADAEAVSYCSVVPEAAKHMESILEGKQLNIFRLSSDQCADLKINYPKREEIGQDRLANALAAKTFYGQPSVVIDMGTAVTFDVLGPEGAYEGGIIAPGLEVMTRYLHEQTALLPQLNEDDLISSSNIGKSTVEAMKLGCAVGFSGMINALLDKVLEGLNVTKAEEVKVIGTGGSAGALLKNLKHDIIIDQDITLRGLAAAYNASSS